MSNHTAAPFVLETLLGSGRHGAVYRATSYAETLPRPVAVKVASSPEANAREADALNRFRHRNIVAADAVYSGALVVELADRGSIQDQIDQRARLPPDEVCSVVVSVLDALECIHGQGWIHGDINPTNIGVRSDGSVALFDFATARPADARPIRETTVAFAGPNPRAEPGVDLRAIAATARACLGPEATPLNSRLAACIRRIDAGQEVHGAELQAVFAGIRPSPIRPGRAERTPGRGSTASFGPPARPARPVGSEPTQDGRRGRAFSIAVLVLGGLLAVGAALATPAAAPPARRSPPISADDVTTAAEASLAAQLVEWDATTASLSRRETGGSRWRVGRIGDLAAIGDWDCDGELTLGVYRPSTSEWFTFSAWHHGSESTPPVVIESGSRLTVRRSPRGCDVPVLVD